MNPLHDVRSAAQLLAISPWTVRAYIRQGKLVPVRIGRLVRLEEEELARFTNQEQVRLSAASSQTSVLQSEPIQATSPLDQMAGLLERFVFLKDRRLYRLLALWVAATHMYSDFEYTGYIFVSSPEPQSGKTRLLEMLDLLVASSSGIIISPTEATMFRTVEGQTQFLDEVDGIANQEQLRNVLNAGFQQDAKVKRMQESQDGGYQPREFPVYAPRVLAGIGNRILAPATRDRTFSVEMVRQKSSERRERLRLSKIREEADAVKKNASAWVMQNKQAITRRYESFDFPYLQSLRDRTIDVAQPLAAILEIAYQDHATLDAVRQEFIEAVAITRNEEDTVTDDHKILQVLTDLARTEDPLVGNSTELAQRCAAALGQAADAIPITAVLRKYSFDTKSIRTDATATPRYRYSLSLEVLVDLLSRYGGLEQDSTSRAASAQAL